MQHLKATILLPIYAIKLTQSTAVGTVDALHKHFDQQCYTSPRQLQSAMIPIHKQMYRSYIFYKFLIHNLYICNKPLKSTAVSYMTEQPTGYHYSTRLNYTMIFNYIKRCNMGLD